LVGLAANYSAPLLELLAAGRADVDWIKLSVWEDFPEQLASARPLRPALLHVLPRAGLADLAGLPWTWDELNQAIAACGSPHVALHLEALPGDWDAPPSEADVVERLVAMTRSWAERIVVPLLVENVPYYGFRGTLAPAIAPDVIRKVCAEAGADLLLDLAHARVTAWHCDEDARAYLAALPLDRVREIHVCGPLLDPKEGLRDRHQEMQAEDYDLLAWALDRTDSLVVTLEYGGTGPLFAARNDVDALERQLNRLARMCGG
jgi:uncharacterized protein (UPF0276 family)